MYSIYKRTNGHTFWTESFSKVLNENVVKHANATEAVILIRNSCGHEEKGLYIFISDDGSGFDYDAELYEGFSGIKRLGGEKHFGLIGMKKRCQLIGAEFSVYSAPGEGTQVSIFKRMRK